MKNFYNSTDVQRLLNLKSRRTAQLRIKSMNDDLKSMGYWTERGKIPVVFFHEKYPYISGDEGEGNKSVLDKPNMAG
ncbi:hypothetical protein HNO13_15515 [Bacillus velezensis]|uniref:hypothetical protein n=1 Tax=Bacillus amyloliquefaciens group TaxID=1938374 RepID=UPI0009F54801|nr:MULTISPECIES: hypothetical protein [Bacillus amyloliquefaciens group]MBW8603106.1 hypothetical protein [Bacillus amyloliquefaciens]MEE3674340.1 hypothetical protein [Bacillus velezensis]OQV40027.1 hypothetical protein B5M57_13980 [Bacillus velezensis]QBK81058.1 hypothetical protein EYS44_15625 [Bacillus velezensis]QJW64185.1 hypothetical protein HNO12_15505 [Bacillus amyloliquefaciens]